MYVFFLWRYGPTRAMASSFLRFLDHTQRRIHAPGGIRTHDLSRRAAADLRLRPRGHWDRLLMYKCYYYYYYYYLKTENK